MEFNATTSCSHFEAAQAEMEPIFALVGPNANCKEFKKFIDVSDQPEYAKMTPKRNSSEECAPVAASFEPGDDDATKYACQLYMYNGDPQSDQYGCCNLEVGLRTGTKTCA